MIPFAALLAATQPAVAPPAPPVPPVSTATAPAASPIDPARLAVAERVVAALVPDGVYVRLMRDQMPRVMDDMFARMGGMTAADLGLPPTAGSGAGQTLDQVAAKADPAYRERASTGMRVLFEGMGSLFGKLEPRLRAGLSRAFACKFTAAQLADLDAFFATPSGRTFANDYLSTFLDPEVVTEMMAMTSELMKAMPDILQKVGAATAHLPPPEAGAGHPR